MEVDPQLDAPVFKEPNEEDEENQEVVKELKLQFSFYFVLFLSWIWLWTRCLPESYIFWIFTLLSNKHIDILDTFLVLHIDFSVMFTFVTSESISNKILVFASFCWYSKLLHC